MSEARIVLVTGTDTGVGKTVVATGLGRALARRGVGVVAVKPVETGCGGEPGEEEDGVRLARATGQARPRAALDRLPEPVAPPVAAELAGRALDHGTWIDVIRGLASGTDVVIVEGAGGLLSPLTWSVTARDLATALGAGAIVVARDGLGCLNHVLLTVEALRAADVPLRGVVLSAPGAPDRATGGHADALGRIAGLERVVMLPRVADVEEAADRLASVADWLVR